VLNDLLHRAETLELYGRRSDVLEALQAGRVQEALRSCKEAMQEAHYRAKFKCAPIGPEAHRRNFDAIAKLRKEIQRQLGSRTGA
jgi:hypothetical protein